ncbi:MAG: TonB-dependent receptor plug domain-containing protein, partial [Burkholderiales bacterium]
LSLEQLLDIEVTSVAARPQRVAQSAASIYVIRQDDIRRSGATSLPEALRLAPNLQVAQGHASGYAISARGFNNSAGNKLLVLIDGRSVYTPLFSGVFWDVQDVMLEDIERIEVVSGPGGTLWGTNAVNGVINVVTRSAANTQGTLVSLGGGSIGADAAARYGGRLGEDGHFRIYAKHLDRGETVKASGGSVDDDWHKSQFGFRADWAHGGDRFSLNANAYRGSESQPAPGTITTGVPFALGKISISGANMTGRWSRTLASGSSVDIQAYVDRTKRTVRPTFAETLDIFDVKFQHTLAAAGGHEWAWGAQYRYARDRVENSAIVAFLPAHVNQSWTSLFAQDAIALTDTLKLTLGARVERNDYTGVELLPNARLAWSLSEHHLLWSALSRAVRSPSRLDRDTFVPGQPPFILTGGPDVRSEIANVVELGYRGRPSRMTSYAATLFYADYDHLRSQELGPGGTSVFYGNEMEGSVHGLELWGNLDATPSWRLSAGALLLKTHLRRKASSTDPFGPSVLGNDPRSQWMLRSSHDLSPRHELDILVRHVGRLPNPEVPAYTAVDARFGWRVSRTLELSLTLQNLFDLSHPEFRALETLYAGVGAVETRSELERGVYFKLLWQL